jgi:hypothetical protein
MHAVLGGFEREEIDGLKVYWPKEYDVNYYIEQELIDKGFKEAIDAAFKTWENAAGRKNIRVKCAGLIGSDDKEKYSNDNNEIRMNPIDGKGNVLARASILKHGGVTGWIYEVDICLDKDEDWTTTGEAGKIDVQTVMTHEVGHLIGLDDVSGEEGEQQWNNEGIIMYYKYDGEGAGVDHDLGKGDIDGLKDIYGKLENGTAGVGGIVVPVDKLALLAPYIGFASTTIVTAVGAVIYVKRVKRRKEKQ